MDKFKKAGEYLNKGEHLVRKTVGEIEKLIGYDIEEEGEEPHNTRENNQCLYQP